MTYLIYLFIFSNKGDSSWEEENLRDPLSDAPEKDKNTFERVPPISCPLLFLKLHGNNNKHNNNIN